MLTTSGKHRRRADGSIDDAKRIRYVCYGKTRSRTVCDGPTGYTQHKLDAIVDKLLHDIFFKMKGVSRDEVIRDRCEAERTERQTHLAALRTAYAKELAELNDLKAEVIRAIRGESAFTAPMLSGLIAEAEERCAAAKSTLEAAEEEDALQEQEAEALAKQVDEIISWADLYDTASMATKKMIAACLIRRIDVYRDYRLHVTFNMDVAQFVAGLDYGV